MGAQTANNATDTDPRRTFCRDLGVATGQHLYDGIEVIDDLQSELSCRAEDEGRERSFRDDYRSGLEEVRQNRERICEGFPGSLTVMS